MKVKIGELKDQLSHYLRIVRETGQEVEVCVRDEPVAMLQSMEHAQRTPPDALAAKLKDKLSAKGLLWRQGNGEEDGLPEVQPTAAGDGLLTQDES